MKMQKPVTAFRPSLQFDQKLWFSDEFFCHCVSLTRNKSAKADTDTCFPTETWQYSHGAENKQKPKRIVDHRVSARAQQPTREQLYHPNKVSTDQKWSR